MGPPKLKKSKPTPAGPSPKLAQISTLESLLTSSSSSSLNPLADLLHLVTSSPEPQVVHKGVYSLGRVFASLVESGKLDGTVVSEKEGGEKERKVREWVRARLAEFVAFLGGLMKDVEKDLRSAGFALLLSLLPLLSHSSPSLPSTSSRPPSYSSPHLRSIVRFILFPTPSTRGGSTDFSIPEEDLDDEDEEEPLTSEQKGLDVEEDVVELIGNVMEEKRDFRWGVYREASILLRPHLPPTSLPSPLSLPSNLLLLLQTQTTPIPSTQKLLEKQALLLPAFARSPFLSSATKEKPAFGETKAVVEGGDWRDYFESDEEEEEEQEAVGAKKGGGAKGPVKKGGAKKGGAKGEGRASGMSVHQGVWSLESHRAGFTSAWMGLLSLPLDASLARRILVVLHHQVLPNMTKGRAVRTADWLGEWVDRGGPLGLLALNGLFILIRDYNLDYPDFYDRLYAMLDRSVLHVKYRSRFFRLAETFLSSSHLPSTLIAAIIKRLGRLSLTAPPAAIVMVIPFIYNLLKLHPGCMVLIHRDAFGGAELSLNSDEAELAKDPYDPLTTNPLHSNALDSSLWEIASQQKHYLPSVSSLAKIFTEVFTKPKYGMEDFLDHTFVTLFDTETKRKIRNDPAMGLVVAGEVFPAAPAPASSKKSSKKRKAAEVEEEEEEKIVVSRDAVAELWSF